MTSRQTDGSLVRGRVVGCLALLCALTACTSGSASHKATSATPSPTASVVRSTPGTPSPSASTVVTGTAAPTTTASATPSSSPSPSATSATPTASVTTATPTAPPLSAATYAKDPAVKALRAWFAEAARTVNRGSDDSAALDKLMTAAFRKTMPHVLGDDVGLHYPGPIPFEVEGLSGPSNTTRLVQVCAVFQGFAQDPRTHEPAATLNVQPAVAHLVLKAGRWIVDDLAAPLTGSCQGRTVPMPLWPKSG